MYKILEKTPLNPTVTKMVIEAPLVAKKAEPGQFIIFRASEDGERVPLTIADYDRKAGTVTIIFQIVGGATMELNALNVQPLHPFAFNMDSGEAGQVRHFPEGEGAATGTVIAVRLEDCRKLPLTVCALAL